MLRSIFNIILDTLFPQRCLGCGEITENGDYLCDYCHEMISVCPADKLCIYCGNLKKNCKCKTRIFHFNGCCAPFINEDIARKIMYGFKFRHKENASVFFSQKMALAIKQSFADIKFDCICFVPMRPIDKFFRGYNQSEILAEKLSEILSIPLCRSSLGCNKKKKRQHKVEFSERFENVKGIYFTNTRFNGKIILLIDDIKTSGATLDQCARQLLIAGAEKVYCVAGLITDSKKGKRNGN